MADRTGIEWTDATWNPVRGCTRVSAGCQHCYAETVAARFSGPGMPYAGLIHPSTRGWNGRVALLPEALSIPWRWTHGRRIFVNSMSDLFHPEVPFEFIAAVFFIMGHTTRHTYQVLTKRPARMLEFFHWATELGHGDPDDGIYEGAHTLPEIKALDWEPAKGGRGGYDCCGPGWPYGNIWLGVSVEDQATADERIPLLLETPAAVRFISMEPMLGAVDLTRICDRRRSRPVWRNVIEAREANAAHPMLVETLGADYPYARLDWVIVGGESGIGARAMHPAWPRAVRDQCTAAGVPFFFKQWGEWRPICEGGADWFEKFYRSIRVARDGEIQEDLDECFGKRCTVPTLCLQRDGNHVDPLEPMAWRNGAMLAFRVGKKVAGRRLDGDEHNAFPAYGCERA